MRFQEQIRKWSLATKVTTSIGVLLLAAIGTYGSIKYYQKVQTDKRNKQIIDFCEQFRWDDKDRESKLSKLNDDALKASIIKFEGDDFRCANYLFLKPKVKKSTTGICHKEDSTYYYRIKSYQAFDSTEDCLKSGGRSPNN